jgi:tRNA (mo5U34)-methyltransferase
MTEIAPDELARRVAATRWYHVLDLGGGVKTPGVYDAAAVVDRMGIAERLEGRSVLDIGAWDGFWSFEAERRGANRVLATDSYSWSGAGWGTKDGFNLAREALGSSVESLEIDVLDLDPARVGTFDLVLFLGVLYHLRDPITAVERVASVTADRMILETVVSLMWLPVGGARLFTGAELEADPTNAWALNTRAVAGLLRDQGFRRVTVHARSPRWEVLRTAFGRWRRGGSFRQVLATQRATFHAER